MAAIIHGRMTTAREAPFVVFLIGMRINKPWRVDHWWPIVTAMPRMIRELTARPELGFLGMQSWLGRTTIMLQYWESFDKLGASCDVGIWHETYTVVPGSYECVYTNMPPFGLGKIGPLVSANAARESARGRMVAGVQA